MKAVDVSNIAASREVEERGTNLSEMRRSEDQTTIAGFNIVTAEQAKKDAADAKSGKITGKKGKGKGAGAGAAAPSAVQ